MMIGNMQHNLHCPFCFSYLTENEFKEDGQEYFFLCSFCQQETTRRHTVQDTLNFPVALDSKSDMDAFIGAIDGSDVARVIKELRTRGGADAKLALVLKLAIEEAYSAIDPESTF